MPGGDGTGPDGKGPKSSNKGWPERYNQDQGQGRKKGGGCSGKGLDRGSQRNDRGDRYQGKK